MSDLYLYLLSFLLLLGGCSGEEGLGGDVDPVEPEEMIAVSFSNSIDLTTKAGTTKADPIPGDASTGEKLAAGVKVVVYAYKQSEEGVPTSPPVVSRTYLSDGDGDADGKGNGNLTVSGSDGVMYLAAGKYIFYALSVNTNDTPPLLASSSHSETDELANATDYLYCATEVTTIASKPGNSYTVSLPFKRLAVALSLQIVNGSTGNDRITDAEAPSLSFAATDPTGSKITLGANPVIAGGDPVNSTENYTSVKSTGKLAEGFTARYIMLPMGENKIPASITFPSISFNGLVQEQKKYALEIPTPTGGFTSGNQYNYKVSITGNEVTFNNVSVTEWNKGTTGDISNDDITEDW